MLPETSFQRHQAAIGAAMIANLKALLDSKRVRVRAETALDQLRGATLKVVAKRELALRARPVHPELAIYKEAAVERLAAR